MKWIDVEMGNYKTLFLQRLITQSKIYLYKKVEQIITQMTLARILIVNTKIR